MARYEPVLQESLVFSPCLQQFILKSNIKKLRRCPLLTRAASYPKQPEYQLEAYGQNLVSLCFKRVAK